MIDEIASIDELFRMLVHTENDIDLRCYESFECPDAFVELPCAYYAKLLDESFSKEGQTSKGEPSGDCEVLSVDGQGGCQISRDFNVSSETRVSTLRVLGLAEESR